MGDATTGTVFDISHWAGHDGPGIRTIVFLKGCPLRCAWCHSPESQRREAELLYLKNKCLQCGRCVTACPQGARHYADGLMRTDRDLCDNCGACVETCYSEALQMCGRIMAARDVVDEVARDRVFFRNSGGGITLSGGEPAAQPQFAEGILRGCHELGIHTALETCGYVPWDAMSRIAPHVDLFLYDLKVMDPARHRRYAGASNARVLANLERLSRTQQDIQVRVPLIPNHTDDDENLAAICRFAVQCGIERIAFLPYNPAASSKYAWLERDFKLPSLTQQGDDRLEAIRMLGESFGLSVQIGG
jgi:pyruvate formate lyase activating enzyme